MKAAALKTAIDIAYNDIERAALASGGTFDLLEKALHAAERGETQHRKAGVSIQARRNYTLSVAYTAKYFVLRWFHDRAMRRLPLDWHHAATVRPDVLYSYGLYHAIAQAGKAPKRPEWLDSVDYARHIAGSAM